MSKRLRRKNLIENMAQLEAKNIGCQDCSGKCCTFIKNSMRVTAVETYDLLEYLKTNDLWTSTLEERLAANIKEFRLDAYLQCRGQFSFRRTYTCPFFSGEHLGCPFPIDVKPYGCMAFNAKKAGVVAGENCESDLSLLEKRENLMLAEEELNREIKAYYDLWWDKESIPVALLDLEKKVKQRGKFDQGL